MRPVIYISGNDSLPEEQYMKQVQEAETKIRTEIPHAAIINPLKLGIPESWNHQDRLNLRLKVMKEANAVIFLPGWIKGPISKQEYFEANNHNKDIFLSNQMNALKREYGHLIG